MLDACVMPVVVAYSTCLIASLFSSVLSRFPAGLLPVDHSATEDAAVLSKNIPAILLMRHMEKQVDTTTIGPKAMYKHLCFGSNYKVTTLATPLGPRMTKQP